jgi:acyl carrier protein
MNEPNKLFNAFMTALGVQDSAEIEKAEYGVTAGWDSMAHMQLISEIESVFDVMLDTDEVISMSSYQRAKEILKAHGKDA